MAIIFIVLFVFVALVAKAKPMPAPVTMPTSNVDVTPDPKVYWLGFGVIAATLILYVIWF